MSRASSLATRVEIPGEVGHWVEIIPASIGTHSAAVKAGDDSWLIYLTRCITAWSYGDAVNDETVNDLMPVTANFLLDAIMALGKHEDDPKNS